MKETVVILMLNDKQDVCVRNLMLNPQKNIPYYNACFMNEFCRFIICVFCFVLCRKAQTCNSSTNPSINPSTIVMFKKSTKSFEGLPEKTNKFITE